MTPIPGSTWNTIFTAQTVVAWAGEDEETPRLGWWRIDLAHEFGGEDLFRRLLLATWQWAVFQALREDAQRRDTQMRRENAESDRLAPFYRFGFEVDDQLSEQWQDLKRSGRSPEEAQPGLRDVMQDD